MTQTTPKIPVTTIHSHTENQVEDQISRNSTRQGQLSVKPPYFEWMFFPVSLAAATGIPCPIAHLQAGIWRPRVTIELAIWDFSSSPNCIIKSLSNISGNQCFWDILVGEVCGCQEEAEDGKAGDPHTVKEPHLCQAFQECKCLHFFWSAVHQWWGGIPHVTPNNTFPRPFEGYIFYICNKSSLEKTPQIQGSTGSSVNNHKTNHVNSKNRTLPKKFTIQDYKSFMNYPIPIEESLNDEHSS